MLKESKQIPVFPDINHLENMQTVSPSPYAVPLRLLSSTDE